MERADKKRFWMHGNGGFSAVAMNEADMASFLMGDRETQLAQGSYCILGKNFFTCHYDTGTAMRAVVIKSTMGCSTGNACFSLRRHSK